ncbi:glycosyltransferase 87 family protein [Dactylosporangium sp. NPDC000555]|uniref:glycosyltransferase 87 family protein n=1 Tax=Dactylosporangium sp. NPDC000555 TaxID=3154260 RepID=UPI003328ECFD
MVRIATDLRPRLLDATGYALCAAFAGVTALTSTLLPHRAWGAIAWIGYAAAALAVLVLGRLRVVPLAFAATALLPLVVQAAQRAAGRTDRAQEEVIVVEHMGARLADTATPYLSHAAITTLPADERLLGYAPYQPGMALFGLPRAAFGAGWWTDARVWFAVVTVFCLVYCMSLLRPDSPPQRSLRLAQAVAVLPLCTLTLATGGDDLPVLTLCLLALALAARDRFVAAGIAVGLAGALKLFALPVALVLLALVLAARSPGSPPASRLLDRFAISRTACWFAVGAFGIPLLALAPALIVDADAYIENALRFPTGHGLVTSPAQSPLPGHLIAASVTGGRAIALALLLLAGAAIAVRLLRRPPTSAGTAAAYVAAGLTAAIMLTPSTRFGYLLYPVAFLALWWSLRPARLTDSA